MALLQKLVNATTLVVCIAFLFYLNSSISQISEQQDEILQFTNLIANGVALSDKQSERLTSIISNNTKYANRHTPICFLKAYQEIVLSGRLNPQDIFNIFEAGKQFSGIETCRHYYSLLIYRLSKVQNSDKIKMQKILNNLLSKQIQNKQPKPICAYFYAYHAEITAKEQMAQIFAQQYNNLNAAIDVDGSKDNTHMFVKYMLEENKGQSNNIQILTNTQRKGFIQNLKNGVQKSCKQDSIILVLDKESVLLSHHAIKIVSNTFSNVDIDIAVFKSLTIGHENIVSNNISDFPNIYPILALRKSKFSEITSQIDKVIEHIKQKSSLINYDHEILVYNLLKDSKISKKIHFSNDAIVYKKARNEFEQQILRKVYSPK